VAVTVVDGPAPAASPAAPHPAAPAQPAPRSSVPEDELRNEALADPTVQALFEIFPVERTKIEEL
jgi:hypothetical protein